MSCPSMAMPWEGSTASTSRTLPHTCSKGAENPLHSNNTASVGFFGRTDFTEALYARSFLLLRFLEVSLQ